MPDGRRLVDDFLLHSEAERLWLLPGSHLRVDLAPEWSQSDVDATVAGPTI